MGKGLPRRPFQIFASGGIDTKTNPQLVPAGSLVELENMWMLKTGEVRMRAGFSALPATNVPTGGLDSLFTDAQGGLMAIARNWNFLGPVAVKYNPSGAAATPGWGPIAYASGRGAQGQYPTATAAVRGVEAAIETQTGAIVPDLYDCDMVVANGMALFAWRQNTQVRYLVRELAGAQPIDAGSGAGTINLNAPPVLAAGGSTFLCALFVNPGTNDVDCYVWNASGTFVGITNMGVAVDAANPFMDAKPVPGGGTGIAVGFKRAAGGVGCLVFDPASSTITVGPVNTAGADANLSLGWFDDATGSGSMFLGTAGSTSGIVLRTMSATTLVVSATTVVDNTAVVGVRQITGHIRSTGPLVYTAIWDFSATYSKIRSSNWPEVGSMSLMTRSFKNADGQYCVVGVYRPPAGVVSAQPSYAVIQADLLPGGGTILGMIMPGYGGDRQTSASRLSSASLVGSTSYLALPRRQRLATAGGVLVAQRGISEVAVRFSSAALCRPRELGGTLFLPGGVVMKDDLVRTSWATSPFYPEVLAGASSATGAMTASGAYSYVQVWRRIDSKGRITRTAASAPFLITLGAGDGRVTLTASNPKLQSPGLLAGDEYALEFFRAGPAAAGATQYNKVGETTSVTSTTDTITFIDAMSDANAALGEFLPSTGNVLEGFATPSCNLLEVNGNRVGIVNAEDPTEFWPSLEYKPGQGIKFNPLLAIQVSGDGAGGGTALAAMDGRWVLFKSTAIYVIGGDGPNDQGQGSFSRPQNVSRVIGTVLPRSVIATPDGIMFQAATAPNAVALQRGIWLLDRGLGLTYIGAPVEQYFTDVVDASLVAGTTQVRFVQANGRCLVWDYFHKRWYTFLLRTDSNGVGSTITACADTASGWCYALADGTVMRETGFYSDTNGTTTAIVPRIGFPHLALDGINGYERFCGVDILGTYVGNHTLRVQFEYDYSGGPTETRDIVVTVGNYQYEVLPAIQKCTSVKITLTTSANAGLTGAFRLTGLTLWAAMKRGTNIPYTKRAP